MTAMMLLYCNHLDDTTLKNKRH